MKVTSTKTNSRVTINVTNELELKQWMNYFRCTRNELILAIKKVGPAADQVENWLQSHLRKMRFAG